jgi:hypothetical protein
MEDFIRSIDIRPKTADTKFYDRGLANRSIFSKHLMTWKKGLLLPWKRACSRGLQT